MKECPLPGPARPHSLIPTPCRILAGNVALTLAATGFASVCATSSAQSWPNKPIRLVIGFPAGGPTDLVARVIAQKMTESLGNQMIVDNRPGAAGNIGAEAVAKAAPDGHTILFAPISFVINPSLYRKVGYDPVKDFAPITMVASTPYLILAHPALPVRNVKTLVALARARPGELNYSSSGNGTGSHLAAEVFKTAAGLNLTHIPFKGTAPAMVALLAGEVSLQFNNPLTGLPQVKAGKLRALAVMSENRSHAAPEVPTLTESGIQGAEVGSWSALLAPAGTPPTIVTRLYNETVRILAMPDVRARLADEGAEIIASGPDPLAANITSELKRWARIVAQSNARLD